jgi:hypothetical protein
MDPPSLKDYYRSVNITSSSFFQNTLEMYRFEVAKEWSALGKPVDRDQWDMTVPTVNAYYNPPGNESKDTLVKSPYIGISHEEGYTRPRKAVSKISLLCSSCVMCHNFISYTS